MEIVSLAPSNTEIIYSLGAENHLGATTSLCDYPPEAAQKPGIGGWSNGIRFEEITEIDPDLALASDDLQDDVVEELRDRGVKVRQFCPHTLNEVYGTILEIGKLLDVERRAEKTVAEMKSGLEALDLDSTRIYCEEWMDPPMVSGNWVPGIVEESGGSYFIDEGERSREFETGELRDFDPEYIFLNVCGAGDMIETDRIIERDEWQEVSAVKRENIFVIDDALLNRPGPRLCRGARKIAEKVV